MPRNFREAGVGEMGIIDKSEKGGGVDIAKIELENKIEALKLEKNKKGLSNGRVKQLTGELKNLEAKLQELQSEKQLEIESTKRKSQLNETKNAAEGKPNWWGERQKMQKEYIAEKKAKQVSDKEITERKMKDNDISATNKDETLPVVEKMTEHPQKKKKVLVLGKEAMLAPDEELVNDEQTIKEKREKVAKAYQENNSQKPMAVQQHFDDKDEYVNNLEARQEMDELAKQPSPETLQEALEKNEEYINSEKEKNTKELQDRNQWQAKVVKELAKENYELQKSLENAKEVESKLAAMESAIEKANKELEAKDASKWEKFKKFWGSSKGKTLIACALVGGIYAGGALAMGATGGASAPLYFGAKALVAKMGGSLWLPYAGGSSSIIGGAAMGGAIHWLGEKIGAIKTDNEAKAAMEGFIKDIQKIKNADVGSEQRPASEAVAEIKTDEPQIIEEKTESFFSKIFGKRGSKEELRIGKNDGELIKKTERMKKTAPEAETGEENKEKLTEILKEEAKNFKIFVESFKNNQKTGKDVFDYLGELSIVYFKDNSKYVNIFFTEIENQEKIFGNKFDKLRIDLIDSMIDYLRVGDKKEQKEKAKQFTTLLFPWTEMSAKYTYSYAGKKENIEWLGWKYKEL